jgi:hypothetical protein
MLFDPGEAVHGSPFTHMNRVDFRLINSVILPIAAFEAQSLQPFGLRPAVSLSYA